jgi:hypothetical protein
MECIFDCGVVVCVPSVSREDNGTEPVSRIFRMPSVIRVKPRVREK